MRIDELIERLTEVREQHGNLEVWYNATTGWGPLHGVQFDPEFPEEVHLTD